MKRSVANISPLEERKRNIDSLQFFQIIKGWGATLVGTGNVSEGLAREFRHLPVAISLAMAHPAGGEGIISKDSLVAYSNQFPAIDARLEKIQKRIESYLRSKGWKAFAIPPDTDKQDSRFVARLFPLFPHKTAATCSGLGWVGKNGLLVNREYGARLSWATVLTDAPFEDLEKPFTEGQCNKCNRCKAMCPAGAIKGKEWSRKNHGESLVDFEKCAAQLSTHHKILGKYVCGHCIVACPVGKQNEVKSWKGGDI